MHAIITNLVAQNEMQLSMWIEFFKSSSSKLMFDAGAIQTSITKISPNKAVLVNVFPNKEKAKNTREEIKKGRLISPYKCILKSTAE